MILLDTHALIWWFDNNPRLSTAAKLAIDTEQQSGLLGISCSAQKIYLSHEIRAWIAAVAAISHVSFIPVDHADRIIVATAMLLKIPIVTTDARIRAYPHVRTIW